MIVKIKIRCIDDVNPLHRVTVKAVKIGAFAIHKEAFKQAGEGLTWKYWNVTHINSGLLIGWFHNIQNAANYAKWLNEQPVDWRRIGSKKDAKRIGGFRKLKAEAMQYMYRDPLPDSVALCRSEGWTKL